MPNSQETEEPYALFPALSLICFIWLLEQWLLNCKISLSPLFFFILIISLSMLPNANLCGDLRTEDCLKYSHFNYA